MKKLVTTVFCLFFTLNSMSASTNFVLPDEISVHEHWISLTKSYDIETRTQKLGTLYRRFFSFLLTYDFYDPMNVKTATAIARFFSFGAHLDIYDQNNSFIGSVEEKIFNFFPTFEILASDASTKVAYAVMNFWGTKFYIYDPLTNKEMAIMSRPFFRAKNDWTIRTTNKTLLNEKNIDSRVFITVLAVQGELEDWERRQEERDRYKRRVTATNRSMPSESNVHDTITEKMRVLNVQSSAKAPNEMNQNHLETLADELEQAFNAENNNINEQNQSSEERRQAFTSYCLQLIDSNNLTDAKKKDILTLLSFRLDSHI